jgi:putative restriction endonuclease
MDRDAILIHFDELMVWKKGDQRAPHKPLLILYALGRWQRGLTEVSFREAEPDLKRLLQEFGPPRRSDHPEQPFWRLQSDGVWTVSAPPNLKLKTGDTIPRVGELRSPTVRAGFSVDVREALSADPALVTTIAIQVLEQHFPESLHQDILSAVGLTLRATRTYLPREAEFRHRVLYAYDHRCAVCGFDVELGCTRIALDAAHIRWHQAGGPPEESNGLALCVLHHKTFDLGAFTVREGIVLVSDQVHGTRGFQEHLMAYHGQSVREPQRTEWRPEPIHLDWHGREVFKGQPRHRG